MSWDRGVDAERRERVHLEALGWWVEQTWRKPIWLSRGGRRIPIAIRKDFFGRHDGMAAWPRDRPRLLLYYQVTRDESVARRRQTAGPMGWNLDHDLRGVEPDDLVEHPRDFDRGVYEVYVYYRIVRGWLTARRSWWTPGVRVGRERIPLAQPAPRRKKPRLWPPPEAAVAPSRPNLLVPHGPRKTSVSAGPLPAGPEDVPDTSPRGATLVGARRASPSKTPGNLKYQNFAEPC